jgi:hypothetical protein
LRNDLVPASEDCNHNWIPDECEPWDDLRLCEEEPELVARFSAPALISGAPGARTTFGATVELALSRREFFQGWSLVVSSAGCRITGATTLGTVADRIRNYTEILTVERGDEEITLGAVSFVSFDGSLELDATGSPHPFLHLDLEAVIPENEAGALCSLSFVDSLSCCGFEKPLGTFFRTGEHEGFFYFPMARLEARNIQFCAGRPFRRGDLNSDGRVDLSDAIRTFTYLFLGAARPACLDAADSNDDGGLDISDGIGILNELFSGEGRIPAPGSTGCGGDPTPDGLSCATYLPCSEPAE